MKFCLIIKNNKEIIRYAVSNIYISYRNDIRSGVFFVCQKIVSEKPGLSIIGVSLAVQVLTLPLYNMAEKWQNVERDTQSNMKSKVNKIKAVFKGDEQYMILSTFYKQQGYHPIFALRSTIGLLIQVPFFIAAFTFLSNLELIQGVKFFFLNDLGSPDALFSIGGFSVNIMPIIMTVVNILSSVIYTKGFSFREKAQLHGMALLFLVLLYNSPSGLVLYWTMNNVFSLVKTLLLKSEKPLRIIYIVSCLFSVFGTIYALFFTDWQTKKYLFCFVTIMVFLMPLWVYFVKIILNFITKMLKPLDDNKKLRNTLFFTTCLGLFLLAGAFIPSALTASSPQEFSFIGDFSSPLDILMYPLYHAMGIFIFWIPSMYFLFSSRIKNILTYCLFSFFIISILNTFIFTGDYGLISETLQFDTAISKIPNMHTLAIDMIFLLVSFITVLFIIRFSLIKYVSVVSGIACVSFFILSSVNYFSTQEEYLELVSILEKNKEVEQYSLTHEIDPIFHVSKDKQNVVVVMLDRAISSFVPYIFEESPEVKKQFDGFVYYPNTMSVYGHTLLGAPPIYGGYEYLPYKMNEREGETLVSKHNEALSVLPVLFLENGFSATVTDAPFANYSWTPDNSIFNEWDINAQNLTGKYTERWFLENDQQQTENVVLQRRFLFFSLFRMVPASFRGAIYLDNDWWQATVKVSGLEKFIDYYAPLDYLSELTDFDSTVPTFASITNKTPHEPHFLQYPDYEPSEIVSDWGNDIWNDENTHMHYHVNIASLQKMGEWFDYLRENGVYDNTRIILVSDHGGPLVNIDAFSGFDGENPVWYNPLLMVKDFNSNEPIEKDMAFMSNADVPHLATQNIIDNAKNPFTNKVLLTDEKENGLTVYTDHDKWDPNKHPKNTFIFEEDRYHVQENIFVPENWTKID